MESWLEKIVTEKRVASQVAAAAKNDELKKRAVFDTKITEFWEAVVQDMTKTIQEYNKAQDFKENRIELQKLPGPGILLQKKAIPSGSLVVKIDRQNQSLQCHYKHESECRTTFEEDVAYQISGNHIGLPLSLTDPKGGAIHQSSVTETVLSRFLKAI